MHENKEIEPTKIDKNRKILYTLGGALIGFFITKALFFNQLEDLGWYIFWSDPLFFISKISNLSEIATSSGAIKLLFGAIVGYEIGERIENGSLRRLIDKIQNPQNKEDNESENLQEKSKEQIQTVQSNSEEPINHIVENPTIQEDYKHEDTTKGENEMENKTEEKKGLNKGIIIGGAVALLIGAGIVVATQFGSKTPKCGDEIVQAKLLTTIKDMNMKSSSFDEATWKSMNYNITDMRTLSYDDKIDAYECAANINMTAFGKKLSSPITYRVSKLDNGDMYIEMHGVEASAQNTQKEAPPTEVANGINNSEISHCTQDEKIVFSCNTGKKIVSVCASQDISPNSGYLQYRFGKLGSPEAIIPSNPQDFRSVAYGWSAKMGSGIGFGVGNFDYSIDTYEGGILTVAQDKKTVATLTCIQDGFFVDDSGDIISMLVYPENYTN